MIKDPAFTREDCSKYGTIRSSRSKWYGGSIKIISNGRPACSKRRRACITSIGMTRDLSSIFVCCTFCLMQRTASRSFSTITASFAPRLSASIAIPPLPLNKSKKRHPAMSHCNILNNVSLMRFVVGLVFFPDGTIKLKPRTEPATTLILIQSSFLVLYI